MSLKYHVFEDIMENGALKYHVFENIMENRAFALLEQMLHYPYYFQKYSKLNLNFS